MGKSVFEVLVNMEPEQRIRFVGNCSLGIKNLRKLGIKRAAKLEELCPAVLSEKILGAHASCEGLNRPGSSCAVCTERFLQMPMPEKK